MRDKEQPRGRQIDALGALAVCLVIALIVGCVIAQIKVFQATGWQLWPQEVSPVHSMVPGAIQTASSFSP
jgi:H+/Cl- antiporter ClcA